MPASVQIPADVDREDRILGELTGRQVIILLVAALAAYLVWGLTGPTALVWFAVGTLPVAVAAVALAFGRRDGVPLDRLLLAALTQRLQTPNRPDPDPDHEPGTDPDSESEFGPRVSGERGRSVVSRVPVRGIRTAWPGPSGMGVLDLGGHGLAVVCSVTPINLGLRSEPEQDVAIAGLARWLHSLTAPVQILSRTRPLDLDPVITGLHAHARAAAHPALAAAAHDHAHHLAALAADTELTTHEYLLVFRTPRPAPSAPREDDPAGRVSARVSGGRRAAQVAVETLARRAGEAAALLGPLGLRVTVLDGAAAARAVHAATYPGVPFPVRTPVRTPPSSPPRSSPPPPSAVRAARPIPAPRPGLRPSRPSRPAEGPGGRRWPGGDGEAPTIEFARPIPPARPRAPMTTYGPAGDPPDDLAGEWAGDPSGGWAGGWADDTDLEAADLAGDPDGVRDGGLGGPPWQVGPYGISEVLDGTDQPGPDDGHEGADDSDGPDGGGTARGWRQ